VAFPSAQSYYCWCNTWSYCS